MRLSFVAFAAVGLALTLAGCGTKQDTKPATPTARAETPENHAGQQPLYRMSEAETGEYLAELRSSQPDLHSRIFTIARRNLAQPYQLYLLGESPFQTIDPEPVYCLGKSDCVVFLEQTLAMSLTDSWEKFLTMLQRIRYENGQIGVLTRNHFTEADWNRNNDWLVEEITEEIGGQYIVRWSQKVDRAKFFKDRYKLDVLIPIQTIEESFIPYEHVDSIKPLLKNGDVVNFVSGKQDGYWVGHVGLVAVGADGKVNLIHSAAPQVREESIEHYIARATADAAEREAANKPRFRGFKFLRVSDDPWMDLRAIDGSSAPKVTVPRDSPLTWEQYLKSFEPQR